MESKMKMLQTTLNKQLLQIPPFEVYPKPTCDYQKVVNKYCSIPENLVKFTKDEVIKKANLLWKDIKSDQQKVSDHINQVIPIKSTNIQFKHNNEKPSEPSYPKPPMTPTKTNQSSDPNQAIPPTRTNDTNESKRKREKITPSLNKSKSPNATEKKSKSSDSVERRTHH